MALWIALVGCERVEPIATVSATRDSAGVRITVVPGALVTRAPTWEASARPLMSMGEATSGGASQYYRITGVRQLSGDRIMFSTDGSKQLITVDSVGTTLAVRGRPGRGPFEFLHLQMLKSADTTALALFDALQRQVTVLPSPTADPSVLSLAALGLGSIIPLVRFADGELLARRPGPLPPTAAKGVVHGVDSLVRVDGQGRIVASFGGHAADDRVLRLNASGGLTGGRPPYRRQLLVDGDDSTVVIAATGEWELRLFDARGGAPRIVRIEMPRRPVDASMRRLYRERVLRDVRDEYGIREWTMLSDDDVFPRELPAFDQLLIDREGAIWLRESVTLADASAQWTVVDRAGVPIARVRLPAAFTPYDVTRDRIAGVWLDSLGGEQVQVWTITRR